VKGVGLAGAIGSNVTNSLTGDANGLAVGESDTAGNFANANV
jgi:hypothetical protein